MVAFDVNVFATTPRLCIFSCRKVSGESLSRGESYCFDTGIKNS